MAVSREAPPQRVILDSGAIIALAKREERARSYLLRAIEHGAKVEVPAVVLAEVLRGTDRDAPVHQVLNRLSGQTDTTTHHARKAGELLGRSRSSSTVDALVVAHGVLPSRGVVLTADPDDLIPLASATRGTVTVISIRGR